MIRIDGYLSNKAQKFWPGALVKVLDDGKWILTRPGKSDLGLGDSFGRACQSLVALIHEHKVIVQTMLNEEEEKKR